MAFPEYGEYDGMGLAALVRSGQVSAREVLDEAIRRAEAMNPALNLLCHKAYDDARRAAPLLPQMVSTMFCQALFSVNFGFYAAWSRSMAFKIVRSFRMTATTTMR